MKSMNKESLQDYKQRAFTGLKLVKEILGYLDKGLNMHLHRREVAYK